MPLLCFSLTLCLKLDNLQANITSKTHCQTRKLSHRILFSRFHKTHFGTASYPRSLSCSKMGAFKSLRQIYHHVKQREAANLHEIGAKTKKTFYIACWEKINPFIKILQCFGQLNNSKRFGVFFLNHWELFFLCFVTFCFPINKKFSAQALTQVVISNEKAPVHSLTVRLLHMRVLIVCVFVCVCAEADAARWVKSLEQIVGDKWNKPECLFAAALVATLQMRHHRCLLSAAPSATCRGQTRDLNSIYSC